MAGRTGFHAELSLIVPGRRPENYPMHVIGSNMYDVCLDTLSNEYFFYIGENMLIRQTRKFGALWDAAEVVDDVIQACSHACSARTHNKPTAIRICSACLHRSASIHAAAGQRFVARDPIVETKGTYINFNDWDGENMACRLAMS